MMCFLLKIGLKTVIPLVKQKILKFQFSESAQKSPQTSARPQTLTPSLLTNIFIGATGLIPILTAIIQRHILPTARLCRGSEQNPLTLSPITPRARVIHDMLERPLANERGRTGRRRCIKPIENPRRGIKLSLGASWTNRATLTDEHIVQIGQTRLNWYHCQDVLDLIRLRILWHENLRNPDLGVIAQADCDYAVLGANDQIPVALVMLKESVLVVSHVGVLI